MLYQCLSSCFLAFDWCSRHGLYHAAAAMQAWQVVVSNNLGAVSAISLSKRHSMQWTQWWTGMRWHKIDSSTPKWGPLKHQQEWAVVHLNALLQNKLLPSRQQLKAGDILCFSTGCWASLFKEVFGRYGSVRFKRGSLFEMDCWCCIMQKRVRCSRIQPFCTIPTNMSDHLRTSATIVHPPTYSRL